MIERLTRLDPEQSQQVLALLAAESERTGRQPLDEVNRMAVPGAWSTSGAREHWLVRTGSRLSGYGVVTPDQSAELSADHAAAATQLLTAIATAHPSVALWTHGDRSAARGAARELGLTSVRELAVMTRPLPPDSPPRRLPDGVTVDSFEAARDAGHWLDLNHRAFAELPDQAAWTRADLDLRLAAPWFEPADFLVARGPDATLAGFHWTKVDPAATAGGRPSGEVYIIAVADTWRGTGLAGALLDLGLQHLTERGMTQVHLFVDSHNRAAITLYESAGFTHVDSDRQYVWPAEAVGSATA